MPRAFYDCPLAAAYMAKCHGFTFIIEIDKTIPCEINASDCEPFVTKDAYSIIEQYYQTHPASYYGTFKYYIHPDSMHLLEPQVGDIMQRDRGDRSLPDVRIVDDDDELSKKITAQFLTRGYKIIQRNGLPFMWPQFEEESK